MNAVIRNDTLWTCHHVGIDGADQDYDEDEFGDTVDRSAIRWLKIQINSDGTLSCSAVGIIADTGITDPYWYYMPSIMVNSSGNALLGFSGSKASEYIGAFYHGRLANGTFPGRIQVLQPGEGEYYASRWGDYSASALDPADSSSFWTVQEYVARDQSWATWIGSIKSQ